MSTYDHIIIGGGTAGSVVAARLSEDPSCSILLIEAGAAAPSPAMADPAAWFSLWGTSVDWAYETVPQRGTAGDAQFWPRGKVLGGSSGINGMMHVRGDRAAYDTWDAAGATGWNYDSLLPFFKHSERATVGDPRVRGKAGPMEVAVPTPTDPLWESCYAGAVEAGHEFNADGNSGDGGGTSWSEANVVHGHRQSAADAYLTPAQQRPNLTVVTEARADRLVFEGTTCVGVDYRTADGIHRAHATGDVVLTAGTIGTPALLLLSGIGPAKDLRALGIDVRADLSGVGANLQDHPKSQLSYRAQHPVMPAEYARKPLVLASTDPAGPLDLQLIFVEFALQPRFLPSAEDGYSILFSLMTPASRGTVRLSSSDPADPPLIDPQYLQDPTDVSRMIAGLRLAREIGETTALAGLREAEVYPGATVQSDEQIHDYLQRTVTTYFHPVGTCRIGTDDRAVVDLDLRVRGIDNLRIADASVMPTLVTGNTNAAVLAIAERAAHLITTVGASELSATASR